MPAFSTATLTPAVAPAGGSTPVKTTGAFSSEALAPAGTPSPAPSVAAPATTSTSKTPSATATPDIEALASSTKPVNTGNMFSGFTSFAGNAIKGVSSEFSKLIQPPADNTLSTNATANALKYLPSELARTIPGVAQLEDDPATQAGVSKLTAGDLGKAVVTGVGETAKGIAQAPLKAAADIYDAGRVFLGKNPNASFNVPVLGKVTSDVYDVTARIQNGENPVQAVLETGSSAIFNTLFFADLVNRVAGPRAIKTADVEGNLNEIAPGTIPTDFGQKTGRLYEQKPVYNKGGAQVLPPEVVEQMKSQGVVLGPKFDPASPTFFRVTPGKGGVYTGEVMQLKPSYLQAAYEKIFGTKTAPASVPALLGAPTPAGTPGTGITPAELSILATKAGPSDVTTLHDRTVKGSDITDAIKNTVQNSPSPAVTPQAPAEQPAAPASMAETVAHNVLRLGNGDTARAKEGAAIIQKEILSHLKTEGEQATHTALQERLGVDAKTADRMIQEVKPVEIPTPIEEPTSAPTAFTKPLSDEEVKSASLAHANANLDDLSEQYIERFGNSIGSDEAKELFSQYSSDRVHSDNVQVAAGKVTNAVYDKLLERNKGKGNNTVLMTAGGTGVGKSTSLKNSGKGSEDYALTYDGNMSSSKAAISRIDRALAEGYKVHIHFVYAPLDKAYDRALDRTEQMVQRLGSGRPVAAAGHIGAHHNSYSGTLETIEHYKDNPNVSFEVADNSNPETRLVDNPIDFLQKIDDTKGNEDELKTSLQRQRTEAYEQGRIGDTARNAYERVDRAREEAQSESRRQLESEPKNVAREASDSILDTVPQGMVNPGAIAADVVHGIKQVGDYVEHAELTTALTGTVNDAIYSHEGQRKAQRQRAIQLLQTQGEALSAQGWENLYHYDENSKESITPEEKKVYDQVIVPLKEGLTKARDEYRALGGHITTDLQMEHTPRYAKEKGGPIDKALRDLKAKVKEGASVYNGGLLSKSVAGGAKGRVFHALTDEDGNRTVVSIPNAKASRITAFNNKVLTDLGPKSDKDGNKFTDKTGKEYTVDQATSKEIKQHTGQEYHMNVLANYVLTYDRTSNALSALKLLDRIQNTPEFGDILMKEDPENAPPIGWKPIAGLPQFRGYYAEPKLAEALTDLGKRLTGREDIPVFDEINNLLTTLVVLNPIMHTPNVAIGWATAESADGSIPGISKNSAKNFARAVNAVKNKDELYLTYLEHGAPLMALKNTAKDFTDAVLGQYSDEVEKNPSQWAPLAKALGYVNPLALAKGFTHLNESITWGSNDILFMHAMLDAAERNGTSFEDTIKDVSKRMADYRMPSRIGPGKIGRAISLAAQSRALLFARYHYSGVIKPWIEGIKDTAGPKSTFKQRREGLRALGYLGLMALVVYPFIDKLLQGITKNPLTYATEAGATKLVQNTEKLAQAGPAGAPAFIAGLATLSPAVEAAIELGFNVDLYTRDPIYSNPQNEGLGGFTTSMLAPISAGSRMTPSDFAFSLFGIYTPKDTSGAADLNAQKYDELPLLQVQVKKDITAGLTDKANAEMKDFNDRAIANYNRSQLSKGLQPLPADGSQNAAFLKEWGIKAPGEKALGNASKLYGDGSLTDKSSLKDKVVTYAKAIGADPVDAFNDIFTGQQIVRVDNAGLFNDNSAVIVQRAPLAYTEGIKKQQADASGQGGNLGALQLDHFLPLEAGGTNATDNLDLVTTEQNQVLHKPVENGIGQALAQGTITRAQALEYIVRFKIGTLHETPSQKYLDMYKDKYNSQPMSSDEVVAAIKKQSLDK